MARSTKITIETESLLIFRGRSFSRSWCAQCGEEVDMVAHDEAHPLWNLLPHETDQGLNSGNLHRTRTPGAELICLNSLLAHISGRHDH